MDSEELQHLLKRYQEGGCSPDELRLLEQLLDEVSAVGTWTWAEEEWLNAKYTLKERIEAAIAKQEKRSFLKLWMKIAAALFFVFFAALFYYSPYRRVELRFTTVYAAEGTVKKLVLSDGSVVYLHGGSRIKYSSEFNNKKRELFLQTGEAFFDVAHNAEKPFVVFAGQSKTQVLGTAFNIRYDNEEKDIQFTVARGKVAVQENYRKNRSKPVFLLANDQLTLEKATGKMHTTCVNYENVIAWLQVGIKLNNESMKNVVATIQNTFRVQIRIADEKTKAIRITAAFDKKDDVNDVLFAICKINKLTYTSKGGIIYIKRK